jgi:histidinol-phosphatase (PHP family)
MGGRFTMSDDSHGIAHLGTNYSRALTFLESLGVTELWTFRRTPHPGTLDGTRAKLEEVAVPLTQFRKSFP